MCVYNFCLKKIKDSLIEGMKQYIPQKPISSKHRLPWVDKAIKKLVQERNKVFKWHRSKSPRLREKLRTIRHRLQKQMRQAYWAYMETIIDFSSPKQRPDDCSPKSFIRSLRKDSSGVSQLRSEGDIHSSAEKRLRCWISNSLQYSPKNLLGLCQTKAPVPTLLCQIYESVRNA